MLFDGLFICVDLVLQQYFDSHTHTKCNNQFIDWLMGGLSQD